MGAESGISRTEFREDVAQLRADFRADLQDAVRPIVEHLATLNGRTRANEVAIAVLQTKVAVVGAAFGFGAGTVGAVVGSLVHGWLTGAGP